MKIKSSSLFLIITQLVMLFVIGTALSWGKWHASLVPVTAAGLAFFLGIIQLFKELLTRKEAKPSTVEEPEERAKPINLRRFGMAFGLVAGFSLSCWILGFIITVPLATLVYARRQGRGWVTSVVFGALLGGFNYGMFEVCFQLYLYRGLIWESIFGS